MKPTEIWQRVLFVSILLFIAISVNVFFNSLRRGPVYYQPTTAPRIVERTVSTPYQPPVIQPKPTATETRSEPERRSRDRDYDSGRNIFELKPEPTKVVLVPYDNLERKIEPEPPPRQKTPEEIAKEHADYVAKYVNSEKREPGAKMLAIAIVSEQGEFNRSLASAIEERIKSGGMKALQSQFTPSFIADGLFTEAFGGTMSVFDKLDLALSLDAVLLGRQTVEYEAHPTLENTITARMSLETVFVPLGKRGRSKSWTFTANGPGFSEKQARSMAEERIVKQIKAATNLSVPFN